MGPELDGFRTILTLASGGSGTHFSPITVVTYHLYCLMVRYDPTIYAGAAVHYRYGRPAYSRDLKLFLLRNLAWMAAERSWTLGAAPESSPWASPACSGKLSAWTPIRR